MIAEVYPLIRLPRKCSYFDYELPNGLKVSPGDLVRIPFKGREISGVVKAIKDRSEADRLVSISSLARVAYVSTEDIERYEHIAEFLALSTSSLLQAVFTSTYTAERPNYVKPTKTLRISPADIPILEKCLAAVTENPSVAIAGDRDLGFALAHVLRRKRAGQMLILMPRERDAELLARYVQLGNAVALLHGKTAPKVRGSIVEAWRNGKIQTLIGTRLASLLSVQELKTVLVLEAGNEEHVNARRNPRFDAREAAKLLATQHEAHFVAFDTLPRLEELATSPLVQCHEIRSDEVIVNLGSADEITAEVLLSESVIVGIENALQSRKKVLLFLNRKGVAKRLQCGGCGHIPLCGTCGHVPTVRHDDLVCANCKTEMWIPEKCPSCGKAKLALRGIGGAKITTTLQKLFPSASVGQIEKGHVEMPEADILLATEYFFSSYLEPFTPKTFGLVADLAADISLHASDFRGTEETARKLHRLIGFANRQGAQVKIQTWLPEILRPMLDLPSFVAKELAIRQDYQLPPSSARIVFHNGVTLDDLPDALRERARERGETIEISPWPLAPSPYPLKNLPDKIKLQYDGPYVQSFNSTPRPQ